MRALPNIKVILFKITVSSVRGREGKGGEEMKNKKMKKTIQYIQFSSSNYTRCGVQPLFFSGSFRGTVQF